MPAPYRGRPVVGEVRRAPVDDGVLVLDRSGDTTDLLPAELLVEATGRVRLEHQVELDRVEADRRGPLDGVLHEPPADAAAPPRPVDEVAGVGDVRGAARAVGLEVVRTGDRGARPGDHDDGDRVHPGGVERGPGERWSVGVALVRRDDAGEQLEERLDLLGSDRPDRDLVVGAFDHPGMLSRPQRRVALTGRWRMGSLAAL
jgi:hypothetical protein